MAKSKLEQAFAAFDSANAEDPNRADAEGEAKEVVYARRMSAWLDRLYPDASEALRLAARSQHIRRWESPREDYAEGRIGYLKWRKDLYHHHARIAGEILEKVGYDRDTIAKVQSLLRKEGLKRNPDSQRLEDVACLVFLENHLAAFSREHDEAKIVDILRKTWAKMSPAGHEAALALAMTADVRRLVEKALAGVASARR